MFTVFKIFFKFITSIISLRRKSQSTNTSLLNDSSWCCRLDPKLSTLHVRNRSRSHPALRGRYYYAIFQMRLLKGYHLSWVLQLRLSRTRIPHKLATARARTLTTAERATSEQWKGTREWRNWRQGPAMTTPSSFCLRFHYEGVL